MNLRAKDVVSNEKLVEIAFGIVLDRIRRKAPKQNIRVLNTKRLHLSHNLSTSRCVRTFSYQCNESDTPTTRTPCSRAGSSGDHSADVRLEYMEQQPPPPPPPPPPQQQQQQLQLPEPAKAPVAAVAEKQLKDAATSVTPQEQAGGDWGRYYMRTDTRSRDTVLACHNSVNSSRSADTTRSRKQHNNRKLAARTHRIPDKHSSSSTSFSCGSGVCSVNASVNASANGSGSEDAGQNKAHHFRVKIDQEQLGRALGSLSASEFPTELLVDVNCSNKCRVSGVSIRQNPSNKQCVLSLKVDSDNGETTRLQQPAGAQSPNPQLVSCCDDQIVKVVEAVPADGAVIRFGRDGDVQAMQSVAST